MRLADNRRILIVDDNPSIHNTFRNVFDDCNERETKRQQHANVTGISYNSQPFELTHAFSGEDAFDEVKRAFAGGRPFALAFVDMRMPPGWDGLETVKHLWSVDENINIVICTSHTNQATESLVDELGETDQLVILNKPFEPGEPRLLAVALSRKWNLAASNREWETKQTKSLADASMMTHNLRNTITRLEQTNRDLEAETEELNTKLRAKSAEVNGTRDTAVFALAQLAESRDPETGEHLRRMREFCQIIAVRLSKFGPYVNEIDSHFLEEFYRSTPLHDIGKVGIPDSILLKPGKLTATEFSVMMRHTIIGATALDSAIGENSFGGFLTMAAKIAMYHHEKFDGSGYPLRLSGNEIPLVARIVAIGDVFDVITSKRVYKPATDVLEAREKIHEACGTHFDPAVVEAFDACFDAIVHAKEQIDEQPSLMIR